MKDLYSSTRMISHFHASNSKFTLTNSSHVENPNQPAIIWKCKLTLFVTGDEVVTVNGVTATGLTHAQAVRLFRDVRRGPVKLQVRRRNTTCNSHSTSPATSPSNTPGGSPPPRPSKPQQLRWMWGFLFGFSSYWNYFLVENYVGHKIV